MHPWLWLPHCTHRCWFFFHGAVYLWQHVRIAYTWARRGALGHHSHAQRQQLHVFFIGGSVPSPWFHPLH